MLFLPFRTYNTDNKKSEESKDLISIESSLYYFACLVLLLQILQKSIVTLAIIYKFGGYKEKGSRYLKNGTQRIKKYEITTTFKPEICRNLTFLLRLRQILIINARIKEFKTNSRDKTQKELTSTKKNRLPYTTYYSIMASTVKHNTGIATKKYIEYFLFLWLYLEPYN